MQHKFSKKQISEHQTEQQNSASEFSTTEDLLRFDAAEVTPPPRIAERLQESLAREESKPWWRRWFTKDDDV